MRDNFLYPVFTTGDMLIPEEILKTIRCSCSAGCKRNSKCSCRAHGVKCSELCEHCAEDCCTNWPKNINIIDLNINENEFNDQTEFLRGDENEEETHVNENNDDFNTENDLICENENVEEIDNDVVEFYNRPSYDSECESESESGNYQSRAKKQKNIL